MLISLTHYSPVYMGIKTSNCIILIAINSKYYYTAGKVRLQNVFLLFVFTMTRAANEEANTEKMETRR